MSSVGANIGGGGVLEESYGGDVVLALRMRVDCGSGLERLVVRSIVREWGRGFAW